MKQKPQASTVKAETRGKIVTIDELAGIVSQLRKSGRTVIQAHGTFDLVHLGHVKHLEAAKKHADCWW